MIKNSSKRFIENYFDVEKNLQNIPFIVIGYFSLHIILRFLLSPNLEVDEAQFVGATDFQLLYGNSHPPLYNWIVRIFLEATNWNWALSLPLVKNLILMAMYLLAFDLTLRITNSYVSASTIILAFLLLPQIVWQSQITLAHSVLVAFGCIAFLHAIILVINNPDWRNYLWLGIAASIGVLSKFHFIIFCLSILAVISYQEKIRRLFVFRNVLLSFGIFFILTLPILIAVILNLTQSTKRISKLYRESAFSYFDLPYVGIDGGMSFFGAFFAWCGPLLVFYLVMYFLKNINEVKFQSDLESKEGICRYIFFYSSLLSAGIFLVIIFIADMHFVHERYLTPILLSLPFWFLLVYSLKNDRPVLRIIARLIAFIMIGVLIGSNAMVMLGKHSLSFPYKEFAQGIGKKFGKKNIRILAARDRDAGNIVINISGAKMVDLNVFSPNEFVLVWRSNKKSVPIYLFKNSRKKYIAVSEVYSQSKPYYYFSGARADFFAQKYIVANSK